MQPEIQTLEALEAHLQLQKQQLASEHERIRAEFLRQHGGKPEAGGPSAPIPAHVGCEVIGSEGAGRMDKCAGCSKRGACSSGTHGREVVEQEVAQRMSFVGHRVMVLSGKGGVGKSMVAAQLAYALERRGFLVGLLDVDICGPTVPKMTGKRGEGVMRTPEGFIPVQVNERLFAMSIGFLVDNENEAVIWRGPRKTGLIQTFVKDVEWGALDFLIVDTPPGTSDEHLSTVQLLKSVGIDGAVVVTSPQDVSVVEVGKEINFCERMGIKVLGVVENFADFCCPVCSSVTNVWPSTSGGGRGLAQRHNVPFLGSVPLDPRLARNGDKGEAVDEQTHAGKMLVTIADAVSTAVGAVLTSH
eukprot:m51a1_g5850 putative Nbp35 (358) ;mRNA; f:332148-333482